MPEVPAEPETPSKRATAARQRKKHDAEVAAIMSAAYRLIDQSDNGSSAIQDILDATGLSRRAFYRHFASKDELIVGMYRADSEKVAATLRERIAGAPTATDAVITWVDHWMGIIYDPSRLRHVRILSTPEAHSAAGFRAPE